MFKVGETYYTKQGYSARILADDAEYKSGVHSCPIVALITLPTTLLAGQVCYFYTPDGKYVGTGNANYDLVSNEPSHEEAELIARMLKLADGRAADKEVELLKVIRQLRNK